MDEQIRHYAEKLAYEIDSWDLKVALDAGEDVIVVDARSSEAYQREHIPGAINLPHRLMTALSTADFDRRSLYVSYCDGIGCNASTKGALNLARLGFRVKELLGGLEWWKRDGHPTRLGLSDGLIECGCDASEDVGAAQENTEPVRIA